MELEKAKIQLANLRAEWAKAPFTAKAVAGAYIPPLLDMIETMSANTEALAAALDAHKKERAEGLAHMREAIAKGEAMGALPDWMLEPFKKAAGMGADHGA